MRKNTVQDFWLKVRQGSGCWLWTPKSKDQDGYGLFSLAGVQWRAHRLAYYLSTGTHPQERMVCHSCDNPPCCNPAHLFLGTALANKRDAIAKGRSSGPIGELNGQHLLSAADAIVIKSRFVPHGSVDSGRQLAKEFGVSPVAISNIVTGRRWSKITTAKPD